MSLVVVPGLGVRYLGLGIGLLFYAASTNKALDKLKKKK